MDRGAFGKMARDAGVVLIAILGPAGGWNFDSSVVRKAVRDDFFYIDRVVSDIESRFAVDPEKIIVSGFSKDASMTWYLACNVGRRFVGFIPITGTMWCSQLEKCKNLIGEVYHYHGRWDGTLPLTGRCVHDKH